VRAGSAAPWRCTWPARAWVSECGRAGGGGVATSEARRQDRHRGRRRGGGEQPAPAGGAPGGAPGRQQGRVAGGVVQEVRAATARLTGARALSVQPERDGARAGTRHPLDAGQRAGRGACLRPGLRLHGQRAQSLPGERRVRAGRPAARVGQRAGLGRAAVRAALPRRPVLPLPLSAATASQQRAALRRPRRARRRCASLLWGRAGFHLWSLQCRASSAACRRWRP